MRALFALLVCSSVLLSCRVGPEPIKYGYDGCHYCSMTIVDRQHGAELVTEKGKVYKFDAIECMINFRGELGNGNVALFLCNSHDQPEELIHAREATFLISEGIPSPMGAFLTAFSSRSAAEQAQNIHEGELYDWNALLQHMETGTYVRNQ
ncbi:nitrous oxide reductase accessory protein NosL [Poritiphilus flavus]|uniref:Copper chaperone NosL n=1 Tax=Poritiphilus flavus TaxID=2697053 RepID=A0A6L9E771_9FLAO|nr:nitrous oxide reductase accessory protein NosL [Poritiphilus flavus]NAS10491.1 hypothetical protein [Poritiphilus flavus]